MSNTGWGRDQQPSNTGGGRSSMGLVVAVLASLVVGAGGGYGALRLSGQDKTEALQQASTEKAELQKQLDQAKADLAALSASASNGNSTVADLQDRLAERTRELDRLSESLSAASAAQQKEADAHQKRLAALATERRDLQATIAAREKALTAAETRTVVLEQRVAELATRLQQSDGSDRQAALEQALAESRQQAERAIRQRDTLTSANDKLQNQLTANEKRITSLERQLAAARDASGEPGREPPPIEVEPGREPPPVEVEPGREPPPVEVEPGREPPPVAGDPKRRPERRVIEAMEKTPGLDRLSKPDYDRLKAALVSGQCVTTGLEAVFDRVPVITLRNLMRDLKSKC